MISCKTCDHYEEYLKDGYVMYCNEPGATVRLFKSNDSCRCIYHTKLDEYANEEQPKHQAIACTKCGHTMRIEG